VPIGRSGFRRDDDVDGRVVRVIAVVNDWVAAVLRGRVVVVRLGGVVLDGGVLVGGLCVGRIRTAVIRIRSGLRVGCRAGGVRTRRRRGGRG